MQTFINVAGLTIAVEHDSPRAAERYRDYLSAPTTAPDISVRVTEEQVAAEKSGSTLQSLPYSDYEFTAILRAISAHLPAHDTLLFHSSVVTVDGRAYAFSGRSGAGKSTHSTLWHKYAGAEYLCGDKPFFRLKEGHFTAYGTPYMGKEQRGKNGAAPLCGICFIEQSRENSIEQLTPADSVRLLLSQTILPHTSPEMTLRQLGLLDALTRAVPVYLLHCDISREAFELSYYTMTKGNIT